MKNFMLSPKFNLFFLLQKKPFAAFLLLLFLFFNTIHVNAASYSVQTTTFSWDTATTNVVWDQTATSYPIDDDKQVVNLGFTFPFGGVNYTQVRIMSNGVLQFGADQAFHAVFNNTALPIAPADRVIAVYWDDMTPSAGGTVRYSTLGSAPNRRFVASWEGVPLYPSAGSYTFQATLYETTGNIKFQYGAGNANGAGATIGVEVDDTDYLQNSFNSNSVGNGTALLFTPAAAVARYGMEQTSWSGAGSVTDDLGSFNASPLGSAVPILPSLATSAGTCRAMSVPVNTSTVIDGINTGIDVNSSIGSQGTISFWYRHRAVWNDGNLRKLFDASRNGGATDATDRNFYLVKQTNGSLLFSIEDTANTETVATTGALTFAANTWVYITVQWDLTSDRVRIYTNGTLQATSTTNTNGVIGDTDTLYIGDARNDSTLIQGATSYTNNSANGEIDEVRIYNHVHSSDMNVSRSCPSVSQYRISHSGTGITCAAEPITIAAYTSTGTLIAPAAGTVITLSTLPATGTWAGGNTYTFTGTETSVIRYLRQITATTLNINVTDGTNTENASFDPNITFVDSALKFYGNSSLAVMPNQIAGTADNAPVLKAIRTDNSTGACVAQVTGTRAVKFAYVCRNPTTCIAGQTLSVNGNSALVQSNPNTSLASPTYPATGINLTFDATGTASIPINYSDVGQIRLFAQLALAASGNDPAFTLTGSSTDFVVKPASLVVSAAQTAGSAANPGTTNSGAGFVSAGTAFKVFVEARNSGGTRTPNFGNETTPETNTLVVNASSLVYPTGGALNGLTNSGTFTATTPAGTFVNSGISWSQVGTITIAPNLTDNDYLGAGNVGTYTASGNVGRFYPDHYALISASVINGCTTFSYMGQSNINLIYTVQAQSLSNGVLNNYDNTSQTQFYAATMATPNYYAEDSDGANGGSLNSRVVVPAVTWNHGVLAITSTAVQFSRQASTAPDGPFTSLQLGLGLTDGLDSRSLQTLNMNAITTGACGGACTAATLGSPLNMRYGRLRLDDGFGPETVSLPVNFATEYWTGSYFVPNTSDSCTLIARNAITYPDGNLLADGHRTVNLTGGSTEGFYTGLGAGGVQFTAGLPGVPDANKLTHYFSAPSAGAQGSFIVTIDLSATPWLLFDWDQNGTYSDATKLLKANFNFGSYRGNDRVIYWREKLQ